MKSKLVALLMVLGVATSAHAQFGGLLGGAKSGGGGDVGAMVEEFNRDATVINEAVSYSLIQIIAALGTKEQIAAVRVINDNLKKTTDPKEKGSIQGTVLKDKTAEAEELLKSKEAASKIASMTPDLQKKVAQSIFAVGIAALKIPDMVTKGQQIVQSVGANPMNIGKVLPVKDGLTVFAAALPKMPTLVSTGLKLMRDAKVDPGTPTKDSKLVPNAEVDIPQG
jgi:hypothetical protein